MYVRLHQALVIEWIKVSMYTRIHVMYIMIPVVESEGIESPSGERTRMVVWVIFIATIMLPIIRSKNSSQGIDVRYDDQ